MMDLEKELIKIGSFYISKHEQIIDAEVKEPIAAIDWGELVNEILIKEHEFQYAKVQLIENFMEAYEHCCDLVE